MSPHARHDHTVRLLAGRLEELALATERRPARHPELETSVLAALAATRHAIQLGLMSVEEADAIWASVAERHPSAPWVRPAA